MWEWQQGKVHNKVGYISRIVYWLWCQCFQNNHITSIRESGTSHSSKVSGRERKLSCHSIPKTSGSGGSVDRACDWQSSGRAIESHWDRLETLAISFTPLCQCLSEETSRWSLLSGAYARGTKRSHTGGKYVTCCGLRPCSIWSIMSKTTLIKYSVKVANEGYASEIAMLFPGFWTNAPLEWSDQCEQGSVGSSVNKGLVWTFTSLLVHRGLFRH